MSTTSSLSSTDDRIAHIRGNIRQLIEQAAGYSGRRMKSDRPVGMLSKQRELSDDVGIWARLGHDGWMGQRST